MSKIKDLIPGELTLQRRKQSKFIYARYKLPDGGGWREKSTGAEKIPEAEEFARQLMLEIKVKTDNNIPTAQHGVDKLIDLYLVEMKHGLREEEISQSNYDLKTRIAKKFVRGYFGGKMLHSIDAASLREFAVWRRAYWFNQPEDAVIHYERKWGPTYRPITQKERDSSVAMLDERAILNSMFRLAVQKRWMAQWQVPVVDFKNPVISKGRTKNKVKPFTVFTPREYETIRREMLEWALRPAKFQYRRIAAYYYVMLAFNCGVRPGTGIDSLRWCDLQAVNADSPDDTEEVEIDGLVFVASSSDNILGDVRLDINVPTSKVGAHKSIGLSGAFWALQDYKMVWLEMADTFRKKQPKVEKENRIEIPEKWDERAPLFLLPNNYRLNGNVVSGFFTKFLEETGMRYAENADDPRSLYSTRHSFITHLQSIGVTDGLISAFTGTSTEMIQKYYSHPDPIKVGHMFGGYG